MFRTSTIFNLIQSDARARGESGAANALYHFLQEAVESATGDTESGLAALVPNESDVAAIEKNAGALAIAAAIAFAGAEIAESIREAAQTIKEN